MSEAPQPIQQPVRRRIAFFISCDSFEGFYGGTFGITRDFFLSSYRNDFVWDYARGLLDAGHPVIIYVLSYGEPGLHTTHEGLQVRFLKLPPWMRPLDRLLWQFRTTSHVPSIRARVAYAAYGAALQQALRDDRIDVLYHQEIWSSRFDLLVQKISLPLVGADHGARFFEWSAPAKRESFPRAAAVTVQTQEDEIRARRFGGNIVFLPNGVDTRFFSPDGVAGRATKNLLAVGRFVEEQKRFSDLLQALALLPEFTLTLVGSGPSDAQLKQLAASLGVENRVHFAGFISDRAQLRQLYRQCAVFVSTSAWEMVALVLLEAMSCGAPIVATRIPSFEAVLEDGRAGLLVPLADPAALADAIRQAYEMGDVYSMGARAAVEERFSSDAVYEQLSDLLQRV